MEQVLDITNNQVLVRGQFMDYMGAVHGVDRNNLDEFYGLMETLIEAAREGDPDAKQALTRLIDKM